MFKKWGNAVPIELERTHSLQLILLPVSESFSIPWLITMTTESHKSGMDPNMISGKVFREGQKHVWAKDHQRL